MAKSLNFKCSECGHDIELEGIPARDTVLCPACAKDVSVPLSKKGKTSGIIAAVSAVVVVFLAIVFILIFFKVQGQRAEQRRIEAKRQAEAAARLKEVKRLQAEEAEKKRWLELTRIVDRTKIKTEDDYFRVLTSIDKYVGGDPDEKDKLKAQLKQFKEEDVIAVMAKLDAAAKVFGDNNEFMKAVSVYQDYKGDFKPETAELRKKGADEYFRKADVAAEQVRLEAEKARKEKEDCINELAGGLINGKISESLTKFNTSPYAKQLPEISKMVNNITKVNEIVIDSFNADIGKKITVSLKEGKTSLLIKKVEDGKVHAEYKKENITIIKKYSVKDLDDSEVLDRLAAFDKSTGALVGGIKAVRKKKYDVAEEHFQNTDTLAIPLMAKLKEYQENQPVAAVEKKVEEDKKDPGPINPKKIKMSVKITKGGKKNLDMGEIAETVNARYSVDNNTGQAINGYTFTILLIGESVNEKKVFKVIQAFSEPLTMKDKASIQKKLTYINKFNDGAEIGGVGGRGVIVQNNTTPRIIAKSGYKYYSWLYVLQDPSGKIQEANSKQSKFEKNAMSILKSGESEFNDDGKPVRAVINR